MERRTVFYVLMALAVALAVASNVLTGLSFENLDGEAVETWLSMMLGEGLALVMLSLAVLCPKALTYGRQVVVKEWRLQVVPKGQKFRLDSRGVRDVPYGVTMVLAAVAFGLGERLALFGPKGVRMVMMCVVVALAVAAGVILLVMTEKKVEQIVK